MNQLKTIGFWVGVMLFVLALTLCYIGWTGMDDVRDAGEYKDAGVLSFVPYDVLPVQVENTSAYSRYRRMNPTKTVYMVYYMATDGSGYRWQEQVAAESMGVEIVMAGEAVERRVLRIPAEGSYVTAPPEETAESYAAGLRHRYVLMMGLSAVYVAGYVATFCILRMKRRRKA